MIDKEKVIKGVESCIKMGRLGVENCRELNCPYFENGLLLSCWIDVLVDALALLKDEKEYCDKCAESAIKTTVELQEEIARLRSLLKEQEAVVHPEPSCEMTYITDCCCDLCGVQLIREDNYCRCCGKRIEWEGR